MHDDSESRRNRRNIKCKKKNVQSTNEEIIKSQEKIENPDRETYESEDYYTEGETTCRGNTTGENVEDDEEIPHRRLKIDKNTVHINGERRRATSRRKSHPPHPQRVKPKLVLPIISPDESNDQIGEEELRYPFDEEDLVYQADVSRTYESISDSRLTQLAPSQESDVVFVEKRNGQGFLKENKNRYIEHQGSQTEFIGSNAKSTTLEFILKMHIRFRNLGMMTHGLVAGLALTQCIFVFSFSNKTLKENYSELAIIFQSLYYILLTISTVSILDRFINVGSDWSELLKHLIAKPLRAIILISYLLSLIFSVSLAQLDDTISMNKSMTSLETTSHKLDTWKVLNMFRVITSIIGWISISCSPIDDITAVTIENMIAKEKEEDELHTISRCEMNSTPVTTISISYEDI